MAYEVIAEFTVPGTEVTIRIERNGADPQIAELLKDKPGTGRWVDQFNTIREPGRIPEHGNYLLFGRQSEEDARKIANFLWADTVQRRDANA